MTQQVANQMAGARGTAQMFGRAATVAVKIARDAATKPHYRRAANAAYANTRAAARAALIVMAVADEHGFDPVTGQSCAS